jgi:hypothetical protein
MITNPIVCLFADECGELYGIWHYWQTPDNTLDVRWMVYEEGCTPSIFHYDYDRHYIYTPEISIRGIKEPGWAYITDPNFTIKELIQRYFCRLWWMYRNCNGGFTYRFNARDYHGSNNKVAADIGDGSRRLWISYVSGGNLWNITWCIYIFWPWCRWFAVRAYLGWKLMGNVEPYEMRAPIAVFFSPFRIWRDI